MTDAEQMTALESARQIAGQLRETLDAMDARIERRVREIAAESIAARDAHHEHVLESLRVQHRRDAERWSMLENELRRQHRFTDRERVVYGNALHDLVVALAGGSTSWMSEHALRAYELAVGQSPGRKLELKTISQDGAA